MPDVPLFIGMQGKEWKEKSLMKREDLAALEKEYKEVEIETAEGEGEEGFEKKTYDFL